MSDLPIGERNFYVGIDPGKYGAIVCLSAGGEVIKCIDMPMLDMKTKGKERDYDLPTLWNSIRDLARLPSIAFGLENPTTRPGESAESSRWFGQGIGYIRMALVAARAEHYLIAPNLWKGRLGIPGKSDPEAERLACSMFIAYYPESAELVRFPSKHSGRADSGLIAHWLRTRSLSGMQTIVDKFGKGSDEVIAHLYRGRSKRCRLPKKLS